MNVKAIESKLQTNITLQTVVGDFIFNAHWNCPGTVWEVYCENTPSNISERQLRDMVTAFKEAKTSIGSEIEMLEEMIKPYVDYTAKYAK